MGELERERMVCVCVCVCVCVATAKDLYPEYIKTYKSLSQKESPVEK